MEQPIIADRPMLEFLTLHKGRWFTINEIAAEFGLASQRINTMGQRLEALNLMTRKKCGETGHWLFRREIDGLYPTKRVLSMQW